MMRGLRASSTNMMIFLWLSSVFLTVELVSPVSATTKPCSDDHYLPLDALLDDCRPCSKCPVNEIIRKPCTIHRDTECGPFYEFQNFNTYNGKVDFSDLNVKPGEERQAQGNGEYTIAPEPQPSDTKPLTVHIARGQKAPSVQTGQEHWKELCYGLIGALVIVTLFAIISVIIIIIVRRRRIQKIGTQLHQQQLHDAEVTVYYDANGVSGHPASGTSGCKHSLIHLESQLEQNRTRRSFWQRLRPAGLPLTQEGSVGNNYMIAVGRNNRSTPFHNVNDPLVGLQGLHAHVHDQHDAPADNQSIPDDSSLQGDDDHDEPAGAAAANVSLYSTDSGIVAGLDQHMSVSDL